MQSMKTAVAMLLCAGGACLAQTWEVGGLAGAGFLNHLNVTAPTGSAVTGFKSGPAFGALIGHNLYPHLSGEIRYSYLNSDLKLASGGNEVTFNGVAHAIHYDLLLHPNRRHAAAQPFLAAGGGVKVFRGTGREAAFQPLNQFALLTKTQEWKPMISVGGGVRFALRSNVSLRAEFRDYLTPFPTKVITPARDAHISGWLHDFVPMVGISFTF